jgi:hypothetical protein
MENVHHFTLYALGVVNGTLAALPHRIPTALVGVYESAMLACFGLLFQAHNHGNPVFVHMHK